MSFTSRRCRSSPNLVQGVLDHSWVMDTCGMRLIWSYIKEGSDGL